MQIDTIENIHPICYAPWIHTETQQTCFSPQAPNIPTITQHTTYMETYHHVPSNAHKASRCLYIHNPTFLNNYNEITPVIFQNTNS